MKKNRCRPEFTEVPDIGQVIHLMLSSGDYPDIIIPYFQPYDLLTMARTRYIPADKPLHGEIRGKYQQDTKRVSICSGGRYGSDGNIYGMPEINEVYHGRLPVKGWVNSSWLRALDMDPPVTTEDFYNMLNAFKEMDPNGNNKADEIPMTGKGVSSQNLNVVAFVMSAFIVDDQNNHWKQPYVEGELDVIFDKPEYREGLRFLHRLYSEGLIDQEFATQDDSTLRQRLKTVLLDLLQPSLPNIS